MRQAGGGQRRRRAPARRSVARGGARPRRAGAKLRAAQRLEQTIELAEKVCEQTIRKRLAGEPISDRLVSLADPDARPIRKGKAGKPTEFGVGAPRRRLGLKPRSPSTAASRCAPPTRRSSRSSPERLLFIAGKRSTAAGASKRTRDRLASYRTGSEGPHQSPQTRLQPQTQPPARRRRHQGVGRLERARLQPRHLRPIYAVRRA